MPRDLMSVLPAQCQSTAGRFLLIALLAIGGALSQPSKAAADPVGFIDLTITGLRSSDGNVRLAVCSTPKCYEDQEGFIKEKVVPADANGVSVRLDGLPEGAYTVMMFHDENGNRRFDRSFVGWPREGFAFSRNAKPGLSKPSYDEVVLTLDRNGITTTVVMLYW